MSYFVACEGYKVRRFDEAKNAEEAALAFCKDVKPTSGSKVFVWFENSPTSGWFFTLNYQDPTATRSKPIKDNEYPWPANK